MIPIKDDNPQINIPYATYCLIFFNLITWLLIQNLGFGSEVSLKEDTYNLVKVNISRNF